MQLIISGRGVTLTAPFKALAATKISRLARVLPSVSDARVTCGAEKFRRTVRVTLRAPRRVLSTAATATELGAALDVAVETLRRRAREEQIRHRLGRRRLSRAVRRRPAAAEVIEPVA